MHLTEEQVQSLLDENEDFLAACLDYQNMGRVYEAYQYQLKLHENLIKLGRFADSCILRHRVLGLKPSLKDQRQSTLERNTSHDAIATTQICCCTPQEKDAFSMNVISGNENAVNYSTGTNDMPSLQTMLNCPSCHKMQQHKNFCISDSDFEGEEAAAEEEAEVGEENEGSSLDTLSSHSMSDSETSVDDLFEEPRQGKELDIQGEAALPSSPSLDMPAL